MSCFGGRDELIYLFEVTVERLRLTADKYQEDFAEKAPLVRIKLIDFPVFEVEPKRDCCAGPSVHPDMYDETEGLIYACGKSVLFVKKPRDLVAAMKTTPLRLGIFRSGETFPIAEATINLSGCLCDQVAMVSNDAKHRPKPYELVGGFPVCDPGGNYAGSINLYLRLTFFGSFIISHYQLEESSCVFKNDIDGELRVTKLKEPEEEEPLEGCDPSSDNVKKFKLDEGTVLGVMRSEGVCSAKSSKKSSRK